MMQNKPWALQISRDDWMTSTHTGNEETNDIFNEAVH